MLSGDFELKWTDLYIQRNNTDTVESLSDLVSKQIPVKKEHKLIDFHCFSQLNLQHTELREARSKYSTKSCYKQTSFSLLFLEIGSPVVQAKDGLEFLILFHYLVLKYWNYKLVPPFLPCQVFYMQWTHSFGHDNKRSTNSATSPYLIFLRPDLFKTWGHRLATMASQQVPRIFLSLPFQSCAYKHWAFKVDT